MAQTEPPNCVAAILRGLISAPGYHTYKAMQLPDSVTPVGSAGHPDDRPLHTRRRLIVFGAGVLTFLLFQLFSLTPGLVEAVYARTLGPWFTRSLSLVTGVFPFSLVELMLLSYAAWLSVAGGRAVIAVARKRRGARNALRGGGLRLARDAGVILFLFYSLWGFNYARRPLAERLEWPAWEAPDTETLTQLATQAVTAANQAYFDIHNTDDAGVPTPMPSEVAELDRALEAGWSRAATRLNLPPATSKRYGRVKRLVLSSIVARFGIAGFYFPWTAEANVLRHSPAVSRAQSMAHEKAHQRGTGPESEASFLGFVAGALAPHPHARYSAFVFAQRHLLAALARADREAWRELASQVSPGVRRDLEDLSNYWRQFQGIGTDVGRAVNDRFLRANRVQGGVLSYGRAVRLLITFAEQNGGNLRPLTDP